MLLNNSAAGYPCRTVTLIQGGVLVKVAFIAVWDNDNTSSRSAVVTPSRFTAPLERDSALSQEITDANRSAGHTISNRTEAGSDHRNDSEAGLDTAASNQAARSCTRAAPGKYDRNDLGHSEDDILWRNSLREIE